ncbi:MAG TPA: hypothetical protein VFI73_14800 [Candidatus Nitrosopolaris sp.]|nr:hypothetical protein [Candidatus Nitrosopolaris sp.]
MFCNIVIAIYEITSMKMATTTFRITAKDSLEACTIKIHNVALIANIGGYGAIQKSNYS